jgi:WD40 repeat protein
VTCMAFSPDSRLLATAGQDKTVRLWDVLSGEPRAIARGHEGKVWAVAFARSGETLLTCDSAGMVRHWDVTPGREVLPGE